MNFRVFFLSFHKILKNKVPRCRKEIGICAFRSAYNLFYTKDTH